MTTANLTPRAIANVLVHTIDPDLSVCESLGVLFRIEGFNTQFSQSATEAMPTIEQYRPNVVVLDLDMDEMSGLSLLRRLKSQQRGLIAICTTAASGEGFLSFKIVEAMRAGAHDVVTKPINRELLVRSVRDALRWDVHIGAREGRSRTIEVHGFSKLTPREREVLELISNGQSNKETGHALGISPRTVEVHRARVMEKLGAKNTADMMRIVLTS